MREIKYIVIHCSATKETVDYSFSQLVADHQRRGFKTCGYNIYIKRNGQTYLGRNFGEELAHAKGYNNNSFAICYEGGLDPSSSPKDTRTPQQKQALISAILFCKLLAPNAQVLGHRDLSPDVDGDGQIEPNEWLKSCPCFNVKDEF